MQSRLTMQPRLNWLDRAISYVSPQAGFRRARARYLESLLSERRALYEGASKSRRTEGWKTRPSSANAETRSALGILRDRSRDLVRNNAYAARAVSVIANNTVGAGILAKVTPASERVGRYIGDRVRTWLDTPACDADGVLTFSGLQHLVMRTVVESGECLIRRRRRRSTDAGPLPLKLQVLEPDFLDSTKEGRLANGNIIIQGVEFNAIGERVAYWLFADHPGDAFRYRRIESKRVPAEDVIHVYRVDRPGQVRGVPWCAPVIIAMRDFADFEDAQLMRQKIAACFAVFVHGEDPTSIGGSSGDTIQLSETVEPGIIEHLPPGKEVSFAQPPGVDGYAESARFSLLKIAAGFGVPYEALTGDLSNVNFSSARMGWLEFQRNVDVWRWQMLIPTLCDGVASWIAESLLLDTSDLRFEWTPPHREMIDPTREIPAMRDAIRSLLISHPEALRELGYDPDAVLAEQKDWLAKIDAAGLVTDSDPRKMTRGGAGVAAPPTGESDNDRAEGA